MRTPREGRGSNISKTWGFLQRKYACWGGGKMSAPLRHTTSDWARQERWQPQSSNTCGNPPGGCHDRHPKCTKTHPSEVRSRPGRALPGPNGTEEVVTGKAKHREWVCPPTHPENSSSREQQPATTAPTSRQLPSAKSNARPLTKQTKTSTGDQEHYTPIRSAEPTRSVPTSSVGSLPPRGRDPRP